MDSNSAKYRVTVKSKRTGIPWPLLRTFELITPRNQVLTTAYLDNKAKGLGYDGEVIGFVLIERGTPSSKKTVAADR